MVGEALAPEPRELVIARVLLIFEALFWLGLGGLVVTSHLIAHEFDCLAGCAVPGAEGAAGWQAALRDPALWSCGAIAILQLVLSWQLRWGGRLVCLLGVALQLLIAGALALAATRIPGNQLLPVGLVYGFPTLTIAWLLVSPASRREWRLLADAGPEQR